jgi:hypothetical protein
MEAEGRWHFFRPKTPLKIFSTVVEETPLLISNSKKAKGAPTKNKNKIGKREKQIGKMAQNNQQIAQLQNPAGELRKQIFFS